MPPSPGDHERFMRLFLEHEPEVLRSVMVFVPQRGDARDIVQDTAVALWEHFSDYDPDRSFVAWAVAFARIHVRRFFREKQRQARLSEKALEALLVAADERADLHERREAALRECLKQIPDTQRAIVEQYYFQDRSVEALASTSQRTPDAVYKILQRVRRSLSDCINLKLREARS